MGDCTSEADRRKRRGLVVKFEEFQDTRRVGE